MATLLAGAAAVLCVHQARSATAAVLCDTLPALGAAAHTQDELAASVTTEQGKTFQDAKGDVFRGLGVHSAQHICLHCRLLQAMCYVL